MPVHDQPKDVFQPPVAGETLVGDDRRFRIFLDSSPDAVAVVDSEGRIRECNHVVADFRGVADPCELVGHTIEDLLAPEDRPKAVEFRRIVLRGGATRRVSVTLVGKSGRRIPAEMIAEATGSEGERPAGSMVIAGVTGVHRTAEDALREKTDELNRLFDLSLDMLCTADADGRFRQVNGAWERILGYTPNQLTGRSYFEFFHPDDAAAALETYAALTHGEEEHGFVVRFRHRNGEYRWLEWQAVRKDGVFYGSARDITDRKQAEHVLRQSEERFSSLFQDAAVPMWEVDASRFKAYVDRLRTDGIGDLHAHFELHPGAVEEGLRLLSLTDVNRGSLRLFRARDARELIDRLPAVLADDSMPAFMNSLIVVAEGTGRVEGEMPIVDLDGQRRYLAVSLSVAPEHREKLGRVMVSMTDITERRRAEKAIFRQAVFDKLMTDLLARFACATGPDIDGLIGDCLAEVGIALGVDSAYVILKSEDTSRWSVVYSWRPRGETRYNRKYQDAPMGTYAWSERMMLAGRTIRINILDELPPEADAERREFSREGVRSLLLIPLRGRGERVYGSVGLRSHTRRIDWTDEDVGRLNMVVDAIANVLERKRAEEKLQTLSSRDEALLAAVPDIIMEADTNHVYVWANKAGRDFFGDDVVGRPTAAFSAGPEEVEASIQPPFQEDESVVYRESWQRRRDGQHRLLGWWRKTLRDASGMVTGTLSTGRDITEQRRAVEALRLSQEKYAKAFDASPDAVVLSEVSNGVFLEVNAGFERMSEYTRDEVVGRSALELGVWNNPQERIDVIARLESEGRVRDFEVIMVSKTKKRMDCLLSAEIIQYGGQPYMLTIMRDIREQKHAMEALRLSQEKYAKAFDSSPDAVVISRVDDGRLLEVNAGFESMFGYTRREAVGSTTSELGLWGTSGDRSRILAPLRTNGCFRNLETRLVGKRGIERDCLMSADIIEIDRQSCMLTTIRDITELKQAQVELAQTKALLSAAIDQSTAGILIARASDGNIVIANAAALNIRQGDMAELIGMPLKDRPHFWQIFKPDGVMFRPEELPLSQAVLCGKTTHNAEAVIKRADGTDRWVLINAAPIVDPAGKVVAGVAVFADVTDIKRVEMMLERLVQGTSAGVDRQFFDSLVRGMAQGMGCRFAYFAEFAGADGRRMKTTAFWNGKKIDRNFEYPTAGIVGEAVTGKKTVVCLKDLAEAYPDDIHAVRLGADSFIGTPVSGAAGQPLGILAVLDDKPIPEKIVAQIQSVMTIAAARAAAEIERQQAYQELQVANTRLLDEQKELMEKNIALQTILNHLERERMEYRRDICTSIDHALTPAIKRLRSREATAGNRDLATLEDALASIIGGGIDTFETNYNKLTPRETEICTRIAQGRTSKEIAGALHLSVQTVHKHREAIRRKLQVQNLDINLSTYLRHRVR